MQAHIVCAHPEPQSYNAHLASTAKKTLEQRGWTVTLSDLYQMGFDPCERSSHYSDRLNPERFDVQLEQREASANGRVPKNVAAEIDLLDKADLLILQYPMWWHLPPAMLKGWFDRVLIYSDVYTSKKRFENGRFVGKTAIVSVTVGTSEATYHHNGRSGDIDLMLWPINFTLAFVGYTVLKPFVAYGVEAGLRYSETSIVEKRLADTTAAWSRSLNDIESMPVVPFNPMADWGADGHIKSEAPVYSPFMRHKKDLDLK